MGKAVDLTGQKFGMLTAISDAGKDRHRMRVWKCVCECGNITTASSYDLRKGVKKSCGCLKYKHLEDMRKKLAEMREKAKNDVNTETHENTMPNYDDVKSSFNDFWMFGEHPDLQEKWFNKIVVSDKAKVV